MSQIHAFFGTPPISGMVLHSLQSAEPRQETSHPSDWSIGTIRTLCCRPRPKVCHLSFNLYFNGHISKTGRSRSSPAIPERPKNSYVRDHMISYTS